MSNAKIRARRRRRARLAWDKIMGFVNYFDLETSTAFQAVGRTNAERQAEGADIYMRELSKLIAEQYPGVRQIHDCFTIDTAVNWGDMTGHERT